MESNRLPTPPNGNFSSCRNVENRYEPEATIEITMARSPQHRPCLLWGAMIAAAVVSALVADASGQVVVKRKTAVAPRAVVTPGHKAPGKQRGDDEAGDNVFLQPDRQLLKKLSQSRKLLAEGRFGEAVRDLDAILEGPEDFFIEPDKNSGKSRGLKAEAQRLIGQMPREGRDLYELQYGARARQMLSEALRATDAAALEKGLSYVSRQFFHTRSGYEATFLLGLHHFDHGRALAGALTLQRLSEAGQSIEEFEPSLSLTMAACWLQADMPDKARETLVALRDRHPALRVAVGGRQTPIFSADADAVGWLVNLIGTQSTTAAADADRWLMFRGDAARNASMLGSAPLLNMRWRVLSTDDPQSEKSLEQCQKTYAECGGPTIPALHPLAVGDVLLMRTLQNLLAVDIPTGKRLWEIPVDEPVERMPANNNGASQVQLLQVRQSLMTLANQRMWTDMTYGTLSSDGRYVFSIEDVGSEASAVASSNGGRLVMAGGGVMRVGGGVVMLNGMNFNGMNNGEQTTLCNQLAAHEIRTGKLKWQIGGPAGSHAQRLADTFFLGPPLPLQSQLYVLAEIKGEIRLLALDAATGDVSWSQQLASAEPDITQDPLRRWAGASPSYADGILVCPTSAGAVVGVELATRSLLWGYSFSDEGNNGRRNAGMFAGVMMNREPSATHWLDDSISISEGRVLATPLDSEWLYCLSLLNGELLWKYHRKDDLYVACADHGKVVLVGRRGVRAVRLSDGKPSWEDREVPLPAGSSPSGRGFLSGNRYFLPLSSAEVVGIDLAAGKIVQTSKSRKGTIPGNLVCFKGNIISQGLEGVDAYYQLDAVSADVHRRLETNPKDAEALSLQGEILLDGGKRSEAIASFRRAHQLDTDPRTRELLRDTILDGLRTEFVSYRGQAAEVEKLLDNSSQHAAYLRAMAAGLRQAGESANAFGCYQKLIDLEPAQRPLDEVDKSLVVRRDRWIRSQLAELRRQATGDVAAKIDQAVAARYQSALASPSVEPLQRFCDGFGDQPAAAQAREELIQRLNTAGRRLDAELAVGSAIESIQPKPNAAQNSAPKRDTAWPVGRIDVSTSPTKNLNRNGYGRCTLNLRGNPGPYFRDLALQFDYNRRAVIAYDPLGREKWQVPLTANGQQQYYYSFNSNMTHGCANGHLLLLCLGWKVIAIDTLGTGSNGSPRVLWTQDLMGQGLDAGNGAFPPQLAALNWQLQRQFAQIHDQSKLLGPVRRGYACFQRFHSVVAVDPRTGETLWSRQNMPFGCDLFGDDEYVFALPPDSDEATVLRAWDGEVVGKRRIPRITGQQVLPNGERKTVFGRFEETCRASFGRNLLLWWPEGSQRVLTLVDPLEGRDLWKGRKFASNAVVSVVNNEVVGVMEPSGRFVLISLPDGRTIADVKLEPESSLMTISLDVGDQYLLLVHGSQGEANAPQFQPMPGGLYMPIHQGRLYAIDRQGKLQWPKPVVIKNQFLLSNQPADVPIVTFACQSFQQKPNGQARYQASVLCIDKRNGRTAFQKTFDNATGLFEVSGDAAKKTVDLTMQQTTVTLTFTDKPLPPPSATNAPSDKASATKKTIHALWDSVQKVLGSGDDQSGREGD
jgi:outer membrane protein assembly factor BamB